MTISYNFRKNRLKIALLLALMAKGDLFGANQAYTGQEEHQNFADDNGRRQQRLQAYRHNAAILTGIGRRNQAFDQSILDAINGLVRPKSMFDSFMIRDVADLVNQYDDPALRQNAQVVYDYLHDVQGFEVDENHGLVNHENLDGRTILHLLAAEPDLGRAKLVLDSLINVMKEYGIDPNQSTELYKAIATGDLALATQLLADGANPNGSIDKNGEMSVAVAERIKDERYNVETYAMRRLRDEIMFNLARASGIYQSELPLSCAVEARDDSFMKLLIEYGAYINCKNYRGQTPLDMIAWRPHRLTRSQWLSRATFLLEHGANVNVRDNKGETPFHHAVLGSIELMQLLLDWGADVNAVDNDGNTPLHEAEANFRDENDSDRLAILAVLYNTPGIIKQPRNKRGKTPKELRYARHDGYNSGGFSHGTIGLWQ